jgi:flagellar L-ring protein FlgH
MMMQPLLAFGTKKSGPPYAECVGSADGNISSRFSRTTLGLRPSGFSAIKRGCLLLLMTGFLWGCAAPIKQVQPMTERQPSAFMAAETPQPTTEGSLWQENVTMGELFVNPKARRVGDIVTIKITESSKASNNATTNTGRDSSMALGLTNFLGFENNFSSSSGGLNPFGQVAGSGTTKFTGTGGTTRSGDLSAYITTRVIGVLPSGNLAISGSREVIVNNETQLIVVSGVIRPRDISSENVVLSTYISDARIAYSGSGIVNDQQRKGWLSNVLDVVSPF